MSCVVTGFVQKIAPRDQEALPLHASSITCSCYVIVITCCCYVIVITCSCYSGTDF